jgi:ubiquinone/menaquinone biosynthesis C-methylase UbiE
MGVEEDRFAGEVDWRDSLSRMERDWDARAREAPEYYIATAHRQWSPDAFFESGAVNVENDILADANVICGGKQPAQMRILEIGCGAGRMTKAIAASFREVHAVDISAEMIAAAKRNLSGLRNVFFYKNNGADLSQFPDESFDLAFSFIVFQHIPDKNVIENYVQEVHRSLRPGAFFKFQVQGDTGMNNERPDTWVGVPISVAGARLLAERSGFDLYDAAGAGSQYLWLWFQKPKHPWVPGPLRRHSRAAFRRIRSVFEKPVAITFAPASVRAGESYTVHIPRFAGQVVDIGYELLAGESTSPQTGVVGKWCELDPRGHAFIPVPAEHPSGAVRITKVRSRTENGPWRKANGAIHVVGATASNECLATRAR